MPPAYFVMVDRLTLTVLREVRPEYGCTHLELQSLATRFLHLPAGSGSADCLVVGANAIAGQQVLR